MDVPITPSVLRWAIDEAGISEERAAEAAGVERSVLEGWLHGDTKPGVTNIRKLASALHRQFAVFLLPEPPRASARQLALRASPGAARRTLDSAERRYIRRAERLQEVAAWLSRELGEPPASLPRASVNELPEVVALRAREALSVSPQAQTEAGSDSRAFDLWREHLEGLGVLVLQFPMGKGACRGFSLWDPNAPVVAVNTAWTDAARIYTLFHELGHLITRTESVCADDDVRWRLEKDPDSLERWCEAFAAAALLPEAEVRAFVHRLGVRSISKLAEVKSLARRFHVSLTASAIRLVELNLASRSLFAVLPRSGDAKGPQAGGGGGGRTTVEIRHDELGDRTFMLFRRGVERGVLERTQALTYLDTPASVFESVSQ